MMLALRPQHVDMAQARDFKSSSQERAATYPILGNGSSAKLGWQMQDYNPQGAAGNAAAATAEKGRAVLDAAGGQLALLLQELCALPLSTLVDQPALISRRPGLDPGSIGAPTWYCGSSRNHSDLHRRCPTPACEGTDSATTASR